VRDVSNYASIRPVHRFQRGKNLIYQCTRPLRTLLYYSNERRIPKPCRASLVVRRTPDFDPISRFPDSMKIRADCPRLPSFLQMAVMLLTRKSSWLRPSERVCSMQAVLAMGDELTSRLLASYRYSSGRRPINSHKRHSPTRPGDQNGI
jgi:hypothetical protein